MKNRIILICILLSLGLHLSSTELKILTMNVLNSIQHGGWEDVNWENSGKSRGRQVVDVIIKTQADIICLQEYLHNNEWIKNKLKTITHQTWYIRVCPRNCAILSKYPIMPHGNMFVTPIQINKQKQINVVSCHMNVRYYLPYLLLSCNKSEALQKAQSNQDLYWQSIIYEITESKNYKTTTILAGDFNEPSHLDYTPQAVKEKIVPNDRLAGLMSNYLLDTLKMKDTWHEYRLSKNMDECSLRGFTWSPTTWDYSPVKDDQRIDFIYYFSDELKHLYTQLVGETPVIDIPGDHVDIKIDPWPSDHRAVLSVFELPDHNTKMNTMEKQ